MFPVILGVVFCLCWTPVSPPQDPSHKDCGNLTTWRTSSSLLSGREIQHLQEKGKIRCLQEEATQCLWSPCPPFPRVEETAWLPRVNSTAMYETLKEWKGAFYYLTFAICTGRHLSTIFNNLWDP